MSGAPLNANINAAWCILALIAAAVLAVMAWRFVAREGYGMRTMRFQLAASLAFVCFGDALNRGVVWAYWEMRAHDMPATWQPSWSVISLVGGIFATFGMSLAIRALTFDRYGNNLWLAATAAAGLGVVAL